MITDDVFGPRLAWISTVFVPDDLVIDGISILDQAHTQGHHHVDTAVTIHIGWMPVNRLTGRVDDVLFPRIVGRVTRILVPRDLVVEKRGSEQIHPAVPIEVDGAYGSRFGDVVLDGVFDPFLPLILEPRELISLPPAGCGDVESTVAR